MCVPDKSGLRSRFRLRLNTGTEEERSTGAKVQGHRERGAEGQRHKGTEAGGGDWGRAARGEGGRREDWGAMGIGYESGLWSDLRY